jgi:hypothetical protein
MEEKISENDLANEKIEIYIAVKEIIAMGRPVTMKGISNLTEMSTSYMWKQYALKGDLMKIIDEVEKQEAIRQGTHRD